MSRVLRVISIFLLFFFSRHYLQAQKTVEDSIRSRIEELLKLPPEQFFSETNDYLTQDILPRQRALRPRLQTVLSEMADAARNPKTKLTLQALKGTLYHFKDMYRTVDSQRLYFQSTLHDALAINDPWLQALACTNYASWAYYNSIFPEAMFYGVEGIRLKEKLGPAFFSDLPWHYQMLAIVSLQTRQYRAAVDFTQKSIAHLPSEEHPKTIVSLYNTLGLAYFDMKQYDSALHWYRTGLNLSLKNHLYAHKALLQGNIGDVYFAQGRYEEALPLLWMDYRVSLDSSNDRSNAANSLQWIARIYAYRQNTDSSLWALREVQKLSTFITGPKYQLQWLQAATLVHQRAGNADSALYYLEKQIPWRDTLTRMAEQSVLKLITTRLDFENTQQKMQLLQQEKSAAIINRNFMLLAVGLTGTTLLLLLNRKRMQLKMRSHMLEQEKHAATMEAASAREQLLLINQTVVDKNNLIATLQQELQHQQLNEATQHRIDELLQSVILTEEDWGRYRLLFDKVYPGFLQRLRDMAPDITIAEQRMAALIRLKLDNHQMATMLGISADSVGKTRRRLRSRLAIAENAELEEVLQRL